MTRAAPRSRAGFGVIYDNVNAAKKSLSKHLLLRDGIIEAKKGKLARKARKERNTKIKKCRGLAKVHSPFCSLPQLASWLCATVRCSCVARNAALCDPPIHRRSRGGDASAASDSALHFRSQRSGMGACGDLRCGECFLALLVHAADARVLLLLGRGARWQGLLQEEEQVDVTPAGECASAGDGAGAGCIVGIQKPKIRFAAHASARGTRARMPLHFLLLSK